MIYVYVTTREPGPRSAGEPVRRYVETSEHPLFVQERNAVGDTLHRRFVGWAETEAATNELVREAEKLLGVRRRKHKDI